MGAMACYEDKEGDLLFSSKKIFSVKISKVIHTNAREISRNIVIPNCIGLFRLIILTDLDGLQNYNNEVYSKTIPIQPNVEPKRKKGEFL
jgi:hypothetical protein